VIYRAHFATFTAIVYSSLKLDKTGQHSTCLMAIFLFETDSSVFKGGGHWEMLPPWRDAKLFCLYCLNNAKFGQLFPSKIVKIVDTMTSAFTPEIHQTRFICHILPVWILGDMLLMGRERR